MDIRCSGRITWQYTTSLRQEATRATSYAASIKPYQRTKNGRDAWLALSSQYAGNDKWEAEIKHHEQLLHMRMCCERGKATLPSRGLVLSIEMSLSPCKRAAAEHVTYQLPNEHSRVGYLLDAIQCSDAGLQAAMASVKTDQSINGLRNDFEAAATHMLPCDPVQKKRVDHETKRGPADISDATGEEAYVNVSSFGTKKGNRSSGVPLLRYHKKEEYDLVNKGQKAELREWRRGKSTEGGKKKGGDHKSDTTKAIASAVEKKVNESLKAIAQEKSTNNDTEAYIMSIMQKHVLGKSGKVVQISDTTAEPTSTATAPMLKISHCC